jgi:hypothetical protein
MDPLLSLAFSMQSNKGVYALLLGSGVSSSAGIPTGWAVVLDLIQKLAAARGETCGTDPASWYRETYGEDADYSKLLDALARTQSERQELLRTYFEPTEEERDDGAKMPTKAHRAIARLAAAGYVRVIITTNFDRLIERALEDVGVAPVVISTSGQIDGAVPLAHMRCCVIKVHGDYLDTRILNTPAELAVYQPAIDHFLDQVFDEFGLITCGWSADWDVALRSALERAPSRRYSTYWATRGSASTAGTALMERRAGILVPIQSADEFFESLEAKVSAIEKFSQPHPLSVKTAVAMTKKYLSEPRFKIKLADLMEEESRRVHDELLKPELSDSSVTFNVETLTIRVQKYDSLCTRLLSIAFECGRWGGDDVVERLQRIQLQLFAACSDKSNYTWGCYQYYPISLTTYAAFLGASISERIALLPSLLSTELSRTRARELTAADVIPPFSMLGEQAFQMGRMLKGMDKKLAPLNDWLAEVLWSQIGDRFVSRADFEYHFDWVEIMIALLTHGEAKYPVDFYFAGSFVNRSENCKNILDRVLESLAKLEEESPYVGVIGATHSDCVTEIMKFRSFAAKLPSLLR